MMTTFNACDKNMMKRRRRKGGKENVKGEGDDADGLRLAIEVPKNV